MQAYEEFLSGVERAWIVLTNGKLLYTQNAGESWDSKLDGVSDSVEDIYFISDSLGWLITKQGQFYKSIDRGQSWSE